MEVSSPHVGSPLYCSSLGLQNSEYVAVGFKHINLEIAWHVARTVGSGKHKQISVIILQKRRALRTTTIESGM